MSLLIRYVTSRILSSVRALLLAVHVLRTSLVDALTPIDNSNFHLAVATYIDDVANATTTFGKIEGMRQFFFTIMLQTIQIHFRCARIEGWDVSAVSDMSYMLYESGDLADDYYAYFASSEPRNFFNEDLSAWDVSSVTDMFGMFRSATSVVVHLSDHNTWLWSLRWTTTLEQSRA